MLTYGSVCSGIESASVAWEPIGMRPLWFSEIEPFPSAVLAHHWPHVPNLGDMTKLAHHIRVGAIPAPDNLVGGTPCQAFSFAGNREGLEDERGQLIIHFGDIANAIDEQRGKGDECVVTWENVPGVLSSKDNAFGCFLGLLAGEAMPLQPSGKRWTNAGCVFGSQRAVAWRILDAQHFGVAQRRRRVFVVASARDGFDPTKVLFESEGLRRDLAPSREPGEGTPGEIKSGSHWDDRACPHPTLNQSHNTGGIGASNQEVFSQRGAGLVEVFGGNRTSGAIEVAAAMNANRGCHNPGDFEAGNLIVHPIHDQATRYAGKSGKGKGNGFGVGKEDDPMFTLTTGDQHAVSYDAMVRRLMPVETERLQGFPNNHTQIPWRNKTIEDCPDGPRYKATGNSKAVPVIRFVGLQIIKEWFRCL